jgi:uncharacterized protein YjiS (DUF1127 family)
MCQPETPHPERAYCVLLFRWAAWFSTWRKRRRDRQLLASLDDRSLGDIGIDRAKVEDDSTVSFWRLH